MIIKEFRCKKHGDFESSHPICPALGCRSQNVERVFLTPPGVKSEFVTRHERGVKKLAQAYGQTDFRTARAGESSKKQDLGQKLLWGNDVKRSLGMDMSTLTAQAAQPFTVQHKDGTTETVPHGMRQAATEMGITRRAPADALKALTGEMTVSRRNAEERKKVTG